VHYRAWVELADQIFRDPEDEILGKERSSADKQALYAETKNVSVKIFTGRPTCSEKLCMDFSFVDETGTKYKANEFSAIAENIYALEIEMLASEDISAEFIVRTPKQTIAFSEISEDISVFAPYEEFTNSELVTGIEQSKDSTKVLRVYFKALGRGAATIEVMLKGEALEISKSLHFKVTDKKEMKVELAKKGFINAGEKLKVVLKDKETKDAITDAFIAIIKDNETLLSVEGDGTENNGAHGIYLLDTDTLLPGKYELTVQRADYKDARYPVIIDAENLLEIEPEIEIGFEKGEREKTIIKTITNNSANTITELTYEVKPASGSLEDFSIEVMLPEQVGPNSTANITIRIVYKGDEEKRAYAEADITIKGVLDVVASAKSRLKISYNKEVPSDCIELDKSVLDVHLIGMINSSETVELKVKYNESEECTKTLSFALNYTTDDPNIEIAGSGFSIAPGEEIVVEAKVFNRIERLGVFEQKVKATLLLEAPEITKSVTLNIYFTDPAFALQTNDNIVLYMSADPETGIIQGSAPLFAKNFGKKPIESLRWSIKSPPEIDVYVLPTDNISYEDATAWYATQPGALPIEMQAPVRPYQYGRPAMESARFVESLAPGEEMEPKTIYAVSTALSLERGPHRAEIALTGTVDGAQFEKVVTVWIIVSTAQCIQIAPVDELYFQSEESSQGVITRNINIRNECGEMLRELSIQPESLGNNMLSLYVLGDKQALMPDETVQAQIILTKGGDYFNTRSPDTIIIRGFLVNSQKFTESNPLPIVVEVGIKPTAEAGPAYQEIEMQVCGESQGVTKEIKFPLLSADTDCDTAYCDAVQLSKYIVEKIEATLESVDRVMQANGDDISNYSMCGESASFCSFASMGLTPEVFTVYMRNDSLEKELLEKEIKEPHELSTFIVEYAPGDVQSILSRATGFTASKLFINKPLSGCGRYKLSVQGALQNIQGKLSRERFFIFVKVVEDRQITPECTLRIQNLMNFLPIDSGIKPQNSYNTWFGAVEAESGLVDVGKAFAESLFKDDSRVNVPLTTNKLKVVLAEIPEGGILKLSVPQVSFADARPVTILAQVNKVYGTADETLQEEIITKAREGLATLSEGGFALEGCISENEDYIVVEQFEQVGELRIEGETTAKLYYDIPSCVDLNVVSDMAETVALKTNWRSLTDNEKAGIKEVWLEVDGEKIEEYGDGTAETPLQLEAVDEEGRVYKKAFKLCIAADDGYVEYAAGKKIKVKAKSLTFVAKEMRNWHAVTLELCGVHPYKLVERMAAVKLKPGEKKVFYATLGWKGSPEEVDLKSIAGGLVAREREAKWKELIEETGKGGKIDETPVGKKILGLKQRGYGAYFGSCMASSAACHLITKPWFAITGVGAFIEASFDCLPVTAAGLLSTTRPGRGFLGSLRSAWDWAKNKLRILWTGPKRLAEGWLPAEEGTQGEVIREYSEEVLPAFILGKEADWLINDLRHYVYSKGWSNVPINQFRGEINTVASRMADHLTKRFESRYLKNASSEVKEMFAEALRKPLQRNIANALRENGQKKFIEVVSDKALMGSVWQKTAASVDMTDIALRYGSGESIGTGLRKQLNKLLDDIFSKVDTGDIAGLTYPNGINVSSGRIDTVADTLTDQIVTRIKEAGQSSFGESLDAATERAIRNTTRSYVRRQLNQYQKTVTRYFTVRGNVIEKRSRVLRASREEVEAIIRRTLDRIKMENGADLIEVYGKKVWGSIADDLIDEPIKQPGRLRRLIDTLKTPRFWGRLLKSAACGVLANWAGFTTFNKYMYDHIKALQEKGIIPEAEVEFAEYGKMLSNYDGEAKLFKNRTYKITISKDDYGTTHYKIELVDTPEELEEMRETIASNPEAYWVDDCREYREEGLYELLGCLVPDVTRDIKAEYAIAYYVNAKKIREASLTYNVQEALIMAALTTQPENFYGCDIDKEWYKQEEQEIVQTINCVALNISEKRAAAGDNIRATFEMLSRDSAKAMRYALNIEAAYRVWNKYNICQKVADSLL
jgi:hypothetical protein